MKTTPYWLAEPRELFTPHTSASGEVDVVVVGGGVTGCSCALALAQRGLRVRVVEAREIAGGASGRNGGFALRGGAMQYDAAWAELWRLTEHALDRIEQLAGDAFRRVGSLRLAASDAERDVLARERELMRADGFDVDWLEPLPAPLERLYTAALFNPGDGAIHPARWVRQLAHRAVAAGAEIVEGEVAVVEELDAPNVVVAADGATGAVLSELAGSVRPVRGQMLATAPHDRIVYSRPHYARDGYDYWQQLPDGRLVIGGRRDASFETEATAVEETTDLVQGELEALAAELLGERPSVTHRWSGIWGETEDRLPVVGRVPGREGVWVAGGYSGHGNVLGFACGELVARAIAGESPPELALFDPARLQLDPRRV